MDFRCCCNEVLLCHSLFKKLSIQRSCSPHNQGFRSGSGSEQKTVPSEALVMTEACALCFIAQNCPSVDAAAHFIALYTIVILSVMHNKNLNFLGRGRESDGIGSGVVGAEVMKNRPLWKPYS